MPALAIDVLDDFDLDLDFVAFQADAAMPYAAEPLQVEPLGVSQAVETARKIEEARAQLRDEMRAEADDRMCRALDQQAARFNRDLEAARRAWAKDEAGVLAQALATAMAEMKARLADATAAALRPFLADAAREKALGDLVDQLGRILADPDHPALAISGPADLLARVAAALGQEARAILLRPDDTPDIRVVAGATIIETRIADWVARLERAGA